MKWIITYVMNRAFSIIFGILDVGFFYLVFEKIGNVELPLPVLLAVGYIAYGDFSAKLATRIKEDIAKARRNDALSLLSRRAPARVKS